MCTRQYEVNIAWHDVNIFYVLSLRSFITSCHYISRAVSVCRRKLLQLQTMCSTQNLEIYIIRNTFKVTVASGNASKVLKRFPPHRIIFTKLKTYDLLNEFNFISDLRKRDRRKQTIGRTNKETIVGHYISLFSRV